MVRINIMKLTVAFFLIIGSSASNVPEDELFWARGLQDKFMSVTTLPTPPPPTTPPPPPTTPPPPSISALPTPPPTTPPLPPTTPPPPPPPPVSPTTPPPPPPTLQSPTPPPVTPPSPPIPSTPAPILSTSAPIIPTLPPITTTAAPSMSVPGPLTPVIPTLPPITTTAAPSMSVPGPLTPTTVPVVNTPAPVMPTPASAPVIAPPLSPTDPATCLIFITIRCTAGDDVECRSYRAPSPDDCLEDSTFTFTIANRGTLNAFNVTEALSKITGAPPTDLLAFVVPTLLEPGQSVMFFQNVGIDYCQNTTEVSATLAVRANITGVEGSICTGEASISFIPNQGPVSIFPPDPFPFRRILRGN